MTDPAPSRTTRAMPLAVGGLALALVLSACGTDVQDSGDEATPSQSPTTSDSPTGSPTGSESPSIEPSSGPALAGPLLLDHRLPKGAAPGIAYVEAGRSLHLPDGTTRPVPHDYNLLAVTGDLVVGAWFGPNKASVDLITEFDVSTVPLGNGLAASPSGETIAWDAGDGTIQSAWDGGQVEMAKGVGEATVTAVSGIGTCYESDSPVGGCTVFYAPRAGPAHAVSSHGIDEVVGSRTLQVSDVAPGGDLAAQTSVSDEGSCWGVQRARGDKFRWESCDYTLLSFSPDGDRLLATVPYLDGLGFAEISVLDRKTGAEQAKFRVPKGYIAGWAWEDAEHALVSTYGKQGWRIIRISASGGAETALEWSGEERDELERPWTLALRPS